MSLRVVEWSTGTVGKHAIAGIDAHPDLELVGVWVSDPAKVGRDAGELAGLGRELGVVATSDVDELLALAPDCIVHTAMTDDRLRPRQPGQARRCTSTVSIRDSPTMCSHCR